MSFFMPMQSPILPRGNQPTLAPSVVRGTMRPKGEPDPDGGADYPRFDNEHGAEVREILATTADYCAASGADYPLLEVPPFIVEDVT